MAEYTDAQIYENFIKHVKELEARGIAGDQDACKSMACMALLAEGWKPNFDPDGGGEGVPEISKVIDLAKYRLAA